MNYKEREHLVKTLSSNIRFDGRELTKFRDIEIETDIISTAEGSARVKCGNSEVLAGVKLSMGTPYPDSPDQGVLMVGCELLPFAHEEIESGPPSIKAIEIGRIIDRGIRESKAVNAKELCITAGEKVWMISVDIVPLNVDGNLIDIGALAALAALKTVRFPELKEDGSVNYKKLSDKPLVVEKEPIAITVGKIGNHLIVDATKFEEDAFDARLTMTVTKDDKFCSLQKNGDVGMSTEEIDKAFDLALKKSKELRSKL